METRRVRFSEHTQVRVMYSWRYAYKKARECYWEMVARDAARFKRRIEMMEDKIQHILMKKMEDERRYMSDGIVNSYMKNYID